MKKLLVILLALVMLLAQVACSQQGEKQEQDTPTKTEQTAAEPAGTDKEQPAEQPKEKVKIEYWSWISTIEGAVQEFNNSQDEVEVVFTTVAHPDLTQKMTIALSAGVGAPDVFQMTQRHFSNYSSTEALYDMTNDVGDLIGEYAEGLQSIVKYNGKIYGLPVDISPGMFWYRADMFKEYGIPEIQTFSDIKKYGKQLRAQGKYILPITTPAGTWACNMIALLVQSRGGTIYTKDGQIVGNNKDLLAALKWIDEMLDEDIAANLPHLTAEFWASLKNGDVAGWLFNMAEGANIKKNMPELSGKWSVSSFPKWDDLDTHYTGFWGGTVMAIPAQSQKAKEALKFVRWVAGTEEGQVAISKYSNLVPAFEKAKANEFYSKGDEYFSGTNLYEKILDTPAFYYFDWSVTEKVIGEQMDLMIAGQITPEQACDAIINNLASETGRSIAG
ncbi:MAG: ABC transporter substrate-binding protein [Bacillota bacterium]